MLTTTILIAEKDSQWMDWASSCSKPEHLVVLLVQDPMESRSQFFERVGRRFERMAREHELVERVVLVAGSQWDGPTLRALDQQVRKLLTRFAPQPLLWLAPAAAPVLQVA